jgi:hypothetical protein
VTFELFSTIAIAPRGPKNLPATKKFDHGPNKILTCFKKRLSNFQAFFHQNCNFAAKRSYLFTRKKLLKGKENNTFKTNWHFRHELMRKVDIFPTVGKLLQI